MHSSALEKFSGSGNTQSSVDKQIEALQTQITDLVGKVNDQINSRFQQLEEKITTNSLHSNSITQSLSSAHEPGGSITAVMASQVIDEYRDRESRKLNIILHNVPESESTESSTRVTHDTNIVADIANKTGIGQVDVSSFMRLEKKLKADPDS